MDVVRLRTMTWKSIITFGKYKDLSVRQIFDLKHTNYLRWVYYNLDGLSFNEEVLIAIKVIRDCADNRIKKPGINPELHEQLNHKFFNKMCEIEGVMRAVNKVKTGAKIRQKQLILRERVSFSKGNMQRINQGR